MVKVFGWLVPQTFYKPKGGSLGHHVWVFGAQYFPNPRETKDLLQDFLVATQKSKFFGIVTPFHKQILDTASTQKQMKILEKPVFYPSM